MSFILTCCKDIPCGSVRSSSIKGQLCWVMQRSGNSLDTMEPLVHTVVLMDVLCVQGAKHLVDVDILGMEGTWQVATKS